MTYPFLPSSAAVIDRPAPDLNSARDITNELISILAGNETAFLAGGPAGRQGFYKMRADAVTIAEAMGARSIIGSGGMSKRTTIALVGPGVGFLAEAEGSLIAGLNFIDAETVKNKNQTAIKVVKNRYQSVMDVRGDQLGSVVQFHGASTYYWHLERCHASSCNKGFNFTEDGNDIGANRGTALNCSAYDCEIGYDVTGSDTADFVSCKSAENRVGLRVGGRWNKWLGGSFEDDSVNAIEVMAGATDTFCHGFTINSTILDNGTRTTLHPADPRDWVTKGVTEGA